MCYRAYLVWLCCDREVFYALSCLLQRRHPMSFDSERSSQSAQQRVLKQRLYEPTPLSLNDEMTLPDRYPAFYDDQTLLVRSSQGDVNGSHPHANLYPPGVYPPAYRP